MINHFTQLFQEIQQKINIFLRRRHSIAPDDDQAVGGFNLAKEFKKIFKHESDRL